jgi:ribonuclease BN (tRNA processing enzyme)
VQLTVLGCAGTFPGPTSPCSGYLVEHDGYRLVLDLGAGAAFEEPPVDGLDEVYDFREPGPGTFQLGPFTVTSVIVSHPIECHGLRLEAGGKVLVYSGDTAACPELVELARDADLFLCEASWPSVPTPPPGIHLTGREAGAHATEAGAKRLLLTHLMPFHDPQAMLAEAKETYDGHIDLVSPGAVYSV